MTGDDRLGLRIARYRDLAGMTQRQLGDSVGVSQAYIAMIERGTRRVVNRDLLTALASSLRVSVSDLIGHPAQRSTDGGSEIHRAVPLIRATLDDHGDAPRLTVDRLARRLEEVQIARMGCDYAELGKALPALLANAAGLAAAGEDPRSAGLYVQALVNAAIVVRPLGYLDLAARLAERARTVAGSCSDPVLMGAADFVVAQATLAGGLPQQASRSWELARTAAARIDAPTDDARVWYGMCHLQAALSAAKLGRTDDANTHLDEAAAVAATTPADHWLQDFTPANVSAWRLAVALESTDPEISIRALQATELRGLRTRQRRARLFGDIGHAYFLAGRPDDAIVAFLRALGISADDVRSRPVIRDIVSGLVLSRHRHPHLHNLVIALDIDPLGLTTA